MSRTKKITLGVTAGALALGAGLGITGVASATTTPTPGATSSTESSPQADGQGRHGGHWRDGGQLASKLATKLGVDQAKVTDALKSFREANKPTTRPTEGTEGAKPDGTAREAALAKSLASALGVDESKVTSALDEIRSEAQADRAAQLKARLDKAVSEGKLTQAEADAVTKAVNSGVIGGRGR